MTAVEKLIAKYEKQWDKYGMGSVISYSQVVSDLEKLKKKEEEQMIEFASYYTPLTKEELEIGFNHKFKNQEQ